MGDMITVATIDGHARFPAYRAQPAGQSRGAIIVIQEIFGLNPGIRAKVDHWAAQGYTAYAPDLFWRDTPGLDLDPEIPAQFQQAVGHLGKFETDSGVADIEAMIRRARADTGGKVGVCGYCLGGLLGYLAATRTDADACVGYYGGRTDQFLDESHAIANPLMLHFAEEDHFIPLSAVEAIRAALSGNPKVEIFVYEGVDHGFASTSGHRRDDAAATLADSRTARFFEETIG